MKIIPIKIDEFNCIWCYRIPKNVSEVINEPASVNACIRKIFRNVYIIKPKLFR